MFQIAVRMETKSHMFSVPILVVVIATTLVVVRSEDTELINKCVYSANKSILDCTGLEKASADISFFIKPETKIIFLRDTEKCVLPVNHHMHSNYLNLFAYQIINSDYFHVTSGAFVGLSNVQFLNIHGVDWGVVENNTFVGLRSLTVMDISHNKIKTLETGAFNHLNKLNTLELSQNLLEVIPEYVFKGLNQLESLYLNNNLVKRIAENAFLGLVKLNIVLLTNNSLQELNSREFEELRNVRHMHFEFNKIGNINGQLKNPSLKFLHLNNNTLTNLKSNVFEQCTALVSIDLAENSLKSIIETPFLKLSNLKFLNLYNNFIDMSRFNTLKKLVHIIHN